jgi:amino acid transporter
MEKPEPGLRRALGVWAITVYAVGDILGAGIYALVGKVAAASGSAAWVSFLVSAVLALLTGLTYAELAARFPVAAGAAAYCRRAFSSPALSFLVGIFVLASGISSAATVSRAFVGYLEPFVSLPPLTTSLAVLALMTAVNYAGIEESARVNLVLTAVELSGLLLVIGVGLLHAASLPGGLPLGRLVPSAQPQAIFAGATIAFFAYIGFEDTVNVAEEVRDPSRALPRAILAAIGFTCFLYAAVTATALLVVPVQTLAESGAPLLQVLEISGVAIPPGMFSLVALFSIGNTGLLNLVMASRLAYGMAREGLLPRVFASVDPVRQTPRVAVLGSFVLASLLTVSGGVQVLAQTTSFLLLCVFALLHVALFVVKRREPAVPGGGFRTPTWTPVIGALLCAALAVRYPSEVVARAAVVLGTGVVLYFVVGRPRRRGAVP